MRFISPDRVKQERLSVLGAELGDTYHALQNEFAWILLKWEQYTALFGQSAQRVQILNEAAPLFFVIVQETFWDDILLHLSRLTDPPKSAGRTNLSIRRLPELIEDAPFKTEVEKLVQTAVESSRFARDWRNRRLAHCDLQLSLEHSANSLSPASRASVNDSLEALRILLKCIHSHYFDRDIDLDFTREPGDANALVRVLADGVEATRARRKRLDDGNLSPNDWLGPPAI